MAALLDLVDPLIGTDSHYGFSTGNCLPLAQMPFGMTAWSPQTGEGGWFFDRRARKLQGIRAARQPSPWIGDYGHFNVMAQTGQLMTSPGNRASAFRLDKSVIKPHYQRFDLIRYGTRMELTPTKRAAHFRITFPKGKTGRVLFEPCAGASSFEIDLDHHCVGGSTSGRAGGCPENFACYFFARFDRPLASFGTFEGNDSHEGSTKHEGQRAGGYAEFEGGGEVNLRIGTSFISIEQAARNLEREIGNAAFEETLERAGRVWEEALGRIEIEDPDEAALRTFYTCLYRTQLFPRIWHEEDEANRLVHFSPYDGQVHEGVLYADNGFWDTYRTMYPLLALLQPERLAEILQGWTNAYKEGGWFPQWASPGYRACMVGTHIDAVITDAVVRGVKDFDVETAFEGLLKHAFHPGDEAGNFGRIGIEDYKTLGYVAADRHDSSVARTLDYAYDDFCIAQVARSLGRGDEAEALMARTKNYEHLWDAGAGFMRGKNADGSWQEPFHEFLWGDPYVEGGPWQSTWAVQHDPAGLIRLMGGPEKFVQKLDQMMTSEPLIEVGTYGFEIHEMTEMACADFGQYAQSNQPVHHVLFLYTAAGYPWKTQYWVRRVMDEMYGDVFPGDEDNGEMSAWYVLNALGLFPLCPGHPSFVFGSPRFRRVTIRPEGKPEIAVEAPDNSSGRPYVSKVTVNGQDHEALWIDHSVLASGATIRFEMSELASTKVVTDKALLPVSIP
ncbi:MAG TPA: GH92 family glycosyl hydrolase [Fimbriimonas sp.]|nr:GH92 family glycosyl hydrolase [Fimbriimonas sp.]